MKCIAIVMVFACSFLFSIHANANALLLSEDPVGDMDLVVVGTILSATPKFDSQNYPVPETEYVAYIEEMIKGWDLLEDGNKTKSIRFDSPGSVDYDGPFHRGSSKIFNVGDRALLMLNQKNGTFQESLWSRTTESDCSGNELIQLMNAPSGLRLYQNNKDHSPFYTNQTITAQYYFYNKNLTASSVDLTLDVIQGFPAIHHPASLSLNLDKCQAYAMGETEFVIEKPGSFSLYSIVNGEESDSVGGIKVIDHIDSPLKQFSSGISVDKIKCNESLGLIQKYDGSPACVKHQTALKLIDRGWGKGESVTVNKILKYSPVLFKGTGVDLKGEELVALLKQKQEQALNAFDEPEAQGLSRIHSLSLSIGDNAYSLDEKYVGNPSALEIRILKDEFTKTNLEKLDQFVRKFVGEEIDIVYLKR